MRVSTPGVHDPRRLPGPVLLVVVDAAAEHLLGEGHDVGSVLHLKVLEAPHLAGRATA